jgi:hypothetical protein
MNRRTKIQLFVAVVVAVGALIAGFAVVRPVSFNVGVGAGAPVSSFVTMTRLADRSEGAALRAAINYLEVAEDSPALGPLGAADAQRAMSSAASADAMALDVENSMTLLLAVYPQLRIRVAPIESRTVASGDGWQVSIWYVATFTLDDEVIDSWNTVTYQMVWERDRWVIDSYDSIEGPVPARLVEDESTPGTEFEAALSGFVDNVGGDR